MCKELEDELEIGDNLAKGLALHMVRMGGASETTFRVPMMSPAGRGAYVIHVSWELDGAQSRLAAPQGEVEG